jgi:hypothetical protein
MKPDESSEKLMMFAVKTAFKAECKAKGGTKNLHCGVDVSRPAANRITDSRRLPRAADAADRKDRTVSYSRPAVFLTQMALCSAVPAMQFPHIFTEMQRT